MDIVHRSVMAEEAFHYLSPALEKGLLVDCTLGEGGIASCSFPGFRVAGLSDWMPMKRFWKLPDSDLRPLGKGCVCSTPGLMFSSGIIHWEMNVPTPFYSISVFLFFIMRDRAGGFPSERMSPWICGLKHTSSSRLRILSTHIRRKSWPILYSVLGKNVCRGVLPPPLWLDGKVNPLPQPKNSKRSFGRHHHSRIVMAGFTPQPEHFRPFVLRLMVSSPGWNRPWGCFCQVATRRYDGGDKFSLPGGPDCEALLFG